MKGFRQNIQNRRDESDPTPIRLRDDSHAQAFWGLAKRNLEKAGVDDSDLAADIAREVSKLLFDRVAALRAFQSHPCS